MADPVPPADPQSPDPAPTHPEAQQPAAAPPKPKRRRLWPKIVIGVLVLLLLLVILGPTIASTALVRHYVVGKVNQDLNGSLEIADWSLGWTGGIDVRGVKIYDDRQAEVISIAHVHTGLSLLDAIRGRYHCGETTVDEPNLEQLVIYPDGSNNVQRVFSKSAPAQPAASAQPVAPSAAREKESRKPAAAAKPLDISGNFTINRMRALVHDQRTNQTITVTPESGAKVKVTSINDPIENAIDVVLRLGSDGAPGTLKLGGTAKVGSNGVVDMEKAVIDEKLDLTALPLQGANAFLALAGQDLELGGTANGSVAVKTTGLQQIAADGQIVATSFTARGKALSGDTYATSKLSVPIRITRQVVDAQTTRVQINSLGVETDHAKLAVSGDLSPEALERIASGQAPGDEGKLSLSVNVPNLKPLADQLPNTLHLQPGVKVAGGQLYHETNLYLSKDKAVVDTSTDVSNVTGTNNGQPVTLSPIHQSADATLLPSRMKLPDVQDVAVTLASGFAEVRGGGKTLANLNMTGDVDLPKFRKEVGQFVDFGKVDLGGKLQFAVSSKGDPTQTKTPIATDARATLTDFKVSGIEGMEPIEEPSVVLTAHGDVDQDASDGQTGINKLAVKATVGEAATPTLDLALQDGQIVFPAKQTTAGQPPKDTSIWNELRGGSVALNLNLPKAYDLIDKLSRKPAAAPAPRVALAQADVQAPRGSGRNRPSRNDAPTGPDAARVAAEAAPTTQPLPPLKVLDGSASVKFAIARDLSTQRTALRDGEIVVEKLALQRGTAKYAPSDKAVALQFAGDVEAAANAVRGLTISRLDGTAFGSSVKMPKPLSVTKLNTTPAASGEVQLAGKIDDVTALLDTLSAKPQGQGYPYHGDYRFAQNVSTSGDVITLAGDGAVADFRVDDAATKQPKFTEKHVTLANQLSYDGNHKNLAISSLKLDMTGSDALHAAVTGSVLGIGGEQAFKDLKLTLNYDLAKLWPIVYAMLSAEQQKDLKDAKVAGKYEKVFTLAGSYPATKSKDEAMRSLVVFGSLAVDLFDGMGVTLEKLDLPIAVQGGALRTLYADRPEGQNRPAPAKLNGGQLDLGGIAVQLTGPEMRVTTPRDLKLVSGATINPLLGNNLGKYINPVFVNSERAKGLLDVTVGYCDGVALGEAMKTPTSGSAKVTFSIRDMDIANPLGSLIAGKLLQAIPTDVLGGLMGGSKGSSLGGVTSKQADAFDGEVRDAVVTLDRGLTTEDITLQLVDPTAASPTSGPAVARQPSGGGRNEAVPAGAAIQPKPMNLQFKGNIRLADLQQNLDVNFPTELLVKFIPAADVNKILLEAFPSGVPLTLRGHTTKPEVDIGEFVKRALPEFAKGRLKAIPGAGDAGKVLDPNAKPEDIVGGLMNALGGKKDKDKDKKKRDE